MVNEDTPVIEDIMVKAARVQAGLTVLQLNLNLALITISLTNVKNSLLQEEEDSDDVEAWYYALLHDVNTVHSAIKDYLVAGDVTTAGHYFEGFQAFKVIASPEGYYQWYRKRYATVPSTTVTVVAETVNTLPTPVAYTRPAPMEEPKGHFWLYLAIIFFLSAVLYVSFQGTLVTSLVNSIWGK